MLRILLYVALSSILACATCTEIGINGFAASRSLLAVGKPTPSPSLNGTLYNVDNCTLLYTRGLSLKYKEKKAGDLYDFSAATPKVSGSCSNSSVETVMKVDYSNLSGNLTAFSMKMVFNDTKSGQWKLEKLTVTVACAKAATDCKSFSDLPFDASFIASQLGFSYHCYRPKAIEAKGDNKNESTFYISFNKLQVQPFKVVEGRFSTADDCIGFFSGGIWSGLFVTLILTLIFAYGIIMINNINVTDRFDDPKGPGIQVNVQE